MPGRGRPGPFKSAIAALLADIAGWRKQITATEILVEQLATRGAGADEGGTLPRAGSTAVPPAKKRKRRRHKSRPAIVRKAKRRAGRTLSTANNVTAAAPEPVAAKVEPTKGVRGGDRYSAQLAELERLKAAILAEDANAMARAYAITVEVDGRARYASWFDRALRMKLKRHDAAGAKPKPKKRKPPRRPPPIVPPIRHDSGWHSENGVLSREIETR